MNKDISSIKYLREKDLPQFVNLWNQDYQSLTSTVFLMTIKKTQDGYKNKIFFYFRIYKNDNLIGFLLLKEDGDLWIKHLLIDRDLRRKVSYYAFEKS